jgi:hypothetical protein
MRRESSTVVVLVGDVDEGLLAELARSPNVSVARAASGDTTAAGQPAPAKTARHGWEPGALAMKEAARRNSTYVVVPEDPLAEVAGRWRAMWDVPGGPEGAARFEEEAAGALAAWRDKQFDLPDYYLVMAPAQSEVVRPDLYLGPLSGVRPRRVAVATPLGAPSRASHLADALRSLEHGPWWPPLDELLDAARRFYPGSLPETQRLPAPSGR